MTTTFSDWGAAEWLEDIDAGEEALASWTAAMVEGQGWPQGAADAITDGANAVQEAIWPWWADAWYALDIALGRTTEPVTEFWTAVYEGMPAWVESAGYDTADLANWDDFDVTVYSAAEAAGTTAEAREQGSLLEALKQTADDPDKEIDWEAVAKAAALWGGVGAGGGAFLGLGSTGSKAARAKSVADSAIGYGLFTALLGGLKSYRDQV